MAKSPFLDPESADADGLVGVGGDLSPRRLLEAYRRGIFPFFDETTPILWWSPDPRAIFELDGFHVSRSLARTLRQGRFTVTVNQAFGEVIRGCADRPGQGIWITPDMIDAYTALHRLGWRTALRSGATASWAAASTAWRSAACSPASRCSRASATGPRWRWRI